MTASETEIRLSQAGGVTECERTYAFEKVRAALQLVTEPVLGVDLRLEHAKDPARVKPVIARLRVNLNGTQLRVHVAADTMHEAVDLLFERFRDRLGHLTAHRRAVRDRAAAQWGLADQPGPWRHGTAPTPRSSYFWRDPDEREVVRRKTFETTSTLDEAVFDLESMDYDFFLFTDSDSGSEAVLWSPADGEVAYHLRYRDGRSDHRGPSAARVHTEPTAAPTMTLAEARESIEAGDQPWLFFTDAPTQRGHLLYRRYDGHYGLITPHHD
ncbi:MAG: HPF/RaiA family ribosome-associated protein [Acidimicrobiales bacterium]